MKKKQHDKQLEQAKIAADEFMLYEYEDVNPFIEYLEYLKDDDGFFNAFEDMERYEKYLSWYSINIIYKCESISDILFRIRKPFIFSFLERLLEEQIISEKECGNLAAEYWSIIEFPSRDSVNKETILEWMSAADKDKLMNNDDLKVYNSLPEVLTVYRGCENIDGLNGMSWTLSEDIAQFFANRYFKRSQNGTIYQAKINKTDVICYINDREEQEIIVDYRKLYDIEQI